jgi:membrane-associated HD superfamily phosphohydrolase
LSTNGLQDVQIDAQLRETLTSFIGAVYMFLAIVSLMAARWMQAALFNPGGFQKEFHDLRVEQKVALLILGLMVLANMGVLIPQTWILYLVMPLIFSGVALIHSVVKMKNLSSMWLVVFYALFMLPLIVQMVVLLALLDSWYDFRARLSST